MSRKPARRKNPSKRYSLKAYERPFGRGSRGRFFVGSAFMLVLGSFVLYQSLLASNDVLGVYTSRLIAEERSGSSKVERAREIQQKVMEQSREKSGKNTEDEYESENKMESQESFKCPITDKESREMSKDECRKLLERKRIEMIESQKRRMEQMQRKVEIASRAGERTREEMRFKTDEEGSELRMEIRKEDGTRERMELRNREGEIRTRIEMEDGRMRVKTSSESGLEVVRDLSETEEQMVRRGLEMEGRAVREEGDRKVIVSGQFKAKSELPISIDAQTNQLVVTTSAGERAVSILPEQAIDNLNARGVVGEVGEEGEAVEVVEEDGEPVYKVEGTEQRRLFGFVPVQVRSTFRVSAVDGSVSIEQGDLLGRLFRAFSF